MILDFNRNELKKVVSALKNDLQLREYIIIKETEINDIKTDENITENIFYTNISLSIVNKISLIKTYTIDELVNPDPSIPEDDRNSILELYDELEREFVYSEAENPLTKDIFRKMMFVIKYFSVKQFFTKNYYRFIPSYDFMNISQNEKTEIFITSIMKEFDRFASIIDDIPYITDIDSVPTEYINYLAQLVGYQKSIDDSLFDFINFREFIKNIIEIYKIKGSSYSIELFFGFIGFYVTIKEMWFDRRMYFLTDNTELNITNKNDFRFYLTEVDPRNKVVEKIQVFDKDMVDSKNLHEFNKRTESGESLEKILGFTNGNKSYSYFKTNVVFINATPYSEDITVDPIKVELIQNFINFLIPIFIQNYTNYSLLESVVETERREETFYFFDLDRVNLYNPWTTNTSYSQYDMIEMNSEFFMCKEEHTSSDNNKPREGEDWAIYWALLGKSPVNNPEYMIHIYSGYQPKRYEWDDGQSNYLSGDTTSDFRKGQGGFYVSGFFNGVSNTLNKYNFSKSYTENEASLKLKRMDFIKRFEETPLNTDSSMLNHSTNSYYYVFMNNNFSYIRGYGNRNSNALFVEKVYSELNSIEKIVIKEIDLNTNTIGVFNNPSNPVKLEVGEKVEVFSLTLSNRGIYTIKDIIINQDTVSLELLEDLKENQGVVGGIIVKYYKDWQYQDKVQKMLSVDNVTWSTNT